MKKFGLLAATFIGLSGSIFAQQSWCGTDSRLNKTFLENPTLRSAVYRTQLQG
jgi:hypothetical protein